LPEEIENAIEIHRRERKALYEKRHRLELKQKAATDILLNKQGEQLHLDMKHSPTAHQLQKMENNIEAALLNMATNTGQGRFPLSGTLYREFDRLKEDGVDPTVVPEHLQAHVDEILDDVTQEDWSRIIRRYQNEIDLDAQLTTCACCGFRAFEMGSVEYVGAFLNELSVLEYTEEQKLDLLDKEKDEFR
jgi:hypothetical protein